MDYRLAFQTELVANLRASVAGNDHGFRPEPLTQLAILFARCPSNNQKMYPCVISNKGTIVAGIQ